MARGTGRDEVRRSNVSALLSRVHTRGPTSRAALTGALGLNRSTIGDIAAQLESLGLVTEEPPVRQHGSGRPSPLVVPRKDVTVLAVALDVDRITVALIGLGGVVLERRERHHQRGAHDVAAVVVSVAQLCRDLLALPAAQRCLGVGVSIPGAVRDGDGLVRFAPNLGWLDQPFTALLSAELHLTVTSGNDADLGVVAEHMRGAAADSDDCAYLCGSVGIGGGFLINGVLLRGAGGYAGEVGHLLVDTDGDECRCGSYGCWETRVGENHLLEGAGRLPGGGPAAVAEVLASASAGEKRAQQSLDECAHWMGVGLAGIVNVFNPDVIIVGGVLGQLWGTRQQQISRVLEAGSLKHSRQQACVTLAALGNDSSLLGAAELAFAPLLADPLRLLPAA